MDESFLSAKDRIPLKNARFCFHQVTPKMLYSPGFSQSIRREFLRAISDDWYKERHLAFASFSDCHFVLMTSSYEFSLCDFSDYDLMKILALCEADMDFCCGSPCEIDLDRLHKHCFKLAWSR